MEAFPSVFTFHRVEGHSIRQQLLMHVRSTGQAPRSASEGQVRSLNLGKLSGLMESAPFVCCLSLIYNLSIMF